jgi:murein DD-endopeptidase MepM/ murein hydrolase activator NlpD
MRPLRAAVVTLAVAALWCALLAAPALAGIAVAPAAFVPAWGSETSSSTLITWSNPVAGHVRVYVTTSTGGLRRVLFDGFQSAGAHEIAWDGSDAHGEPLAAGAYVIRIDRRGATPTAAESRVHSRASVRAAAETAVVRLQAAPLALRTVRLVHGSIGATKAHAAIVGKYAITAPATVAAAVVDARGRIVRSLQSGAVSAGTSTLTWNGRTAAGHPVADGSYALLVSAASGGRPTATVRTPLRVDRHAPTLRAAAAVRAATSRVRVLIPLAVAVNEPATVALRLGARHTSWRQAAGTRSVRLSGTALGLTPSRRARTVRVRVNAADATGNLSTRVVTVIVPAIATHRAPPKHTAAPTTPTKPPAVTPPASSSGKLAWPVNGVITSPFGQRWGRMHEGLDIGVDPRTAVHAAAAGTVISAGTMGDYGVQVTLQHANGLSTRYAHFTSVALGLVAGDTVAAGQLLGLSGCTGSCTGPHVHFEVRVGGIAKNPRLFLP